MPFHRGSRNDEHSRMLGTHIEVLEAAALKLAPADRLHLFERLIASLDSDPKIEKAWELEADRRVGALKTDCVAEVSGGEAMDRLWIRLVR
jgi:hypothetical protein